LWNSAVRDNLQYQHRNPLALSIQDSPIHSERINNHRINEDLQMNTALSEIKKWNSKRKEENHTNALTVDLLDNSETTPRLTKYTVLFLPDTPE
jgi:hypothetical protein